MLFAKQNVFEASGLQRHQPAEQHHLPFLIHVLPHHQNRRDQEYQLH